jgi:hypothetical protein
MKIMTLALAAATVLSLGAARADDTRKDPRDTDPMDRVMLVHSAPANADQRDTNPTNPCRANLLPGGGSLVADNAGGGESRDRNGPLSVADSAGGGESRDRNGPLSVADSAGGGESHDRNGPLSVADSAGGGESHDRNGSFA